MSLNSARLYWTCQIVGWGGYAIAQSLAAALTLNLPWPRVVVEALLLHGSALGLTHQLRAYMKRHHWSSLSQGKRALRSVAAGFVLGVPLGIATQFTRCPRSRIRTNLAWRSSGRQAHRRPAAEHAQLVDGLHGVARVLLRRAGLRKHRSAELRQSELKGRCNLPSCAC